MSKHRKSRVSGTQNAQRNEAKELREAKERLFVYEVRDRVTAIDRHRSAIHWASATVESTREQIAWYVGAAKRERATLAEARAKLAEARKAYRDLHMCFEAERKAALAAKRKRAA